MEVEDFLDAEMYKFNEQIEFKEDSEVGTFEGILVKYEAKKLAHGIFRFGKDSLKINNGKQLFILYQHDGNQMPVGTMVGQSDSEGFKIKAKLDLSLLENGNPVNPEAHKIYSLMKNQKTKFELSVGGYIKSREIIENANEERYIKITEFDAYEGSIVMRGAVDGSKINKVFNENINGGTNNMDKELSEFLQKFDKRFTDLEGKMLKADSEKEFKELHAAFEEFKKSSNEAIEELKASVDNTEAFEQFNEKLNSLDSVIKTLKQDYRETNKKEYSEYQEVFQMLTEANSNKSSSVEFESDKEFKFAATVSGLPDAIKPTYVTKILERIQEANPVLRRVNFDSILDGSLKISREELGLPTVGIVNGDEERYETTTSDLKGITIELYQWYVQPIFQNKLDGTNYVGFVAFVLKRAEYAMGLFMANKLLNGSGIDEPLGILKDATVTLTKEFDLTPTTGKQLNDFDFAKQLKSMYYACRSEVAGKSTWFVRRGTWEYITNLVDENGRFYFNDLIVKGEMTIKGRPVEFIESENAGLADINTAKNGDNIILFGDITGGVRGIQNSKLSISIRDQVTKKGYTKYWMEKGIGFGVQLPENFVIGKLKK